MAAAAAAAAAAASARDDEVDAWRRCMRRTKDRGSDQWRHHASATSPVDGFVLRLPSPRCFLITTHIKFTFILTAISFVGYNSRFDTFIYRFTTASATEKFYRPLYMNSII